MEIECSITRKLENKALQWYGHERMPEHRWPKRVLEWEPPGRRRRGRPALRWETYIGHAMIDRDLRVGDWNEDLNKVTADRKRLKQLLDEKKRRNMDVKSNFERIMMNLLENKEQHEVTLKDLKKCSKEDAALENEIKRLKALDQLKKAEKGCDQAKDKNAKLKQTAQLEAENTCENKNSQR
nr:unnamed protein product [Callosobruchus chinensis]